MTVLARVAVACLAVLLLAYGDRTVLAWALLTFGVGGLLWWVVFEVRHAAPDPDDRRAGGLDGPR